MMDATAVRHILTLGVAIIAALFAADADAQTERDRGGYFIVREGDEAPRFSFVTVDGDTLDSDLLRGQVTVIQFAASWCPFSKAQVIDHQKYIWDKYKDTGRLAMYIVCEDDTADRASFALHLEDNGITIPYGFDENEQVYQLFCTPRGGVTRTVVITPDWHIAELHTYHTWADMRQIRKCVRRLYRGK